VLDNAANSMQWMARILTMKGNTKAALDTLRYALKFLKQQGNDKFLANTLYAFAEAFRKTGNADSVAYYLKEYQVIHDRLEKASAESRTEFLQMRLDYNNAVQKILYLNKDKKRISLIRNFTIAIILLATALGYIYLNRERLKAKMKQKQAQEEKQKAEAEATNARLQLSSFTENLREKTRLVEDLQAQLLNKELNEEQINNIQQLSRHSILTDQDWDHFRELFNKVYPDFFIGLRRDVSDITTAELRMAALIKLQIPVKDAATLLGISPNSVHKNRQRLKSRLGLEHEEELESYILRG
jgi:hypothetical protein